MDNAVRFVEMKRLWRTKDWKIIGKDGLHPIMCDECPCATEQCRDAVSRFKAAYEVTFQGVLFHRESMLTGPGAYENSPWYALEYPEPALAANIDYSNRKIHYVDCNCDTRTVDMDLVETDENGENPVVTCSGYWAAFWPYTSPCSCLDVREVLGGINNNSTEGSMHPFNEGGRGDVWIGDDTEIELVSANGTQSLTSVYMMDQTFRDRSPYTLFTVRTGWNDSTSLFDSFDFIIMSPLPSIYVWRSEGRYISYRIRNAARYQDADSPNMNWCHKGFKWLRDT